MMEKCNVVEEDRTPDHEYNSADENWDKDAAAAFKPAEDTETTAEAGGENE